MTLKWEILGLVEVTMEKLSYLEEQVALKVATYILESINAEDMLGEEYMNLVLAGFDKLISEGPSENEQDETATGLENGKILMKGVFDKLPLSYKKDEASGLQRMLIYRMKSMMEKNKYRRACQSCEHVFEDQYAKFCTRCGEKVDLSHLLGTFTEDFNRYGSLHSWYKHLPRPSTQESGSPFYVELRVGQQPRNAFSPCVTDQTGLHWWFIQYGDPPNPDAPHVYLNNRYGEMDEQVAQNCTPEYFKENEEMKTNALAAAKKILLIIEEMGLKEYLE